MNRSMKTQVERQPTKKRQNLSSSKISEFFFTKLFYKKDEMQQKQFLEDLTLLIVNNHLLLHFLESPWLKQFALQLNSCIVFPSKKINSQETLPNLVQKTKDVHVLPKLFRCMLTITSFDLWMSKGTNDIFALVINF